MVISRMRDRQPPDSEPWVRTTRTLKETWCKKTRKLKIFGLCICEFCYFFENNAFREMYVFIPSASIRGWPNLGTRPHLWITTNILDGSNRKTKWLISPGHVAYDVPGTGMACVSRESLAERPPNRIAGESGGRRQALGKRSRSCGGKGDGLRCLNNLLRDLNHILGSLRDAVRQFRPLCRKHRLALGWFTGLTPQIC